MKSKTLKVLSLMLLVAILSLSLAGCGGGTANKELEKPAETGGETPKAPQKTIELTFASPFPATHSHQIGILEPFADEVFEKTDGRVKINIHAGGSVSGGTQVYDDVLSGAVDLGWIMMGYTPGRFPLTEMIEFPVHYKSPVESTNTLCAMFETNKAFQEEFKGVKVLAFFTSPMGEAYTSKKPIKGIADFKGIHFRSATAMVERVLKSLGATAANMPMGDTYDAADRGIVQGVCTDDSAIENYKLYEVLKYATHGLSLYASPHTLAMSWDAWNRLSSEDQAIIDGIISDRKLSLKAAELYVKQNVSGFEKMKSENMEIYNLTDDDKKVFIDHVQPVIKGYIEELEAKGLPAQEVYNEMIRIRDSFRQ
jgi:TRAP-type C4-dicarboxylate transport system substrate-binding protein